MPRKNKTLKRIKKSTGFMDKRVLYASLVIMAVIVLGFGGTLFNTFGIDSIWGADTQFDVIKYNDVRIASPEELPEYQFNVGSRTITINYDGVPAEEFDWSTATSYWGTKGIIYVDAGMKPKVNYDVGTFKYFNEITEEIAEAVGNLVISTDGETADIHFYFGFSIGFSTAATVLNNGQDGFRIYVPSASSQYAYYSESIVETGTVDMVSEVALRFSALSVSENITYTGHINAISVINQYSYYVTRPADYTGDDFSIDTMNAEYDWNSRDYYSPGKAVPIGVPEVKYNQIDSDTEDMAIISAGVSLTPGVDPQVQGEYPGVADIGSLVGYVGVVGIDVYNVGYIYDILVDVSLNDIPLVNPDASFLLGRLGLVLPQTEPLPWFNSNMVLIIAMVLGFVLVGGVVSKRR
jgi:hypothetical protein